MEGQAVQHWPDKLTPHTKVLGAGRCINTHLVKVVCLTSRQQLLLVQLTAADSLSILELLISPDHAARDNPEPECCWPLLHAHSQTLPPPLTCSSMTLASVVR